MEISNCQCRFLTRAVCASLLPVLQSMAGGGMCKCSGDVAKVKVAMQRHDFRIDEVEQYSGRDNIMVHELKEEDGENTNDVVIAVAAAAEVPLTNGDISASHRVGRPGNAREANLGRSLCGSCDVIRGRGFSETRKS